MTSADNSGSAVEARQVSFSYGKTRALEGLNLIVPAAASFGLVGPNGAGKSTLIRIIVGLMSPQRGSLRVLDKANPHDASSEIGYMPQLSALYLELSARENVDFFARIYGVGGRGERSGLVDESIRLVGLQEKRDDSVFRLSGGMRQRVSLACAIVHRPRLLVLDEPTVGLDPELRVAFWEHFRALTRSGVTLIVSSHTMDDAAHCDRLAFLREGKVVAEGSPMELIAASGSTEGSLEDAFLRFSRKGTGT
ncbi:MAG: ABC transporter ATP-binding protein [Dehalococcoidia bacterium]|nr:ABC transporter ATP-binding protein [Dehalococcoidia bacterium]